MSVLSMYIIRDDFLHSSLLSGPKSWQGLIVAQHYLEVCKLENDLDFYPHGCYFVSCNAWHSASIRVIVLNQGSYCSTLVYASYSTIIMT